MSVRWSFDDHHIGEYDSDVKGSLLTQRIVRPKGLVLHDWYNHAGDVCRLLDSLCTLPDACGSLEAAIARVLKGNDFRKVVHLLRTVEEDF